MGICVTCDNTYDKTFEVVFDNKTYTFDCFECAIHYLAPICNSCGMKVIGHGVESNERIYCGAHCARKEGIRGVHDRSDKLAAKQVS